MEFTFKCVGGSYDHVSRSRNLDFFTGHAIEDHNLFKSRLKIRHRYYCASLMPIYNLICFVFFVQVPCWFEDSWDKYCYYVGWPSGSYSWTGHKHTGHRVTHKVWGCKVKLNLFTFDNAVVKLSLLPWIQNVYGLFND